MLSLACHVDSSSPQPPSTHKTTPWTGFFPLWGSQSISKLGPCYEKSNARGFFPVRALRFARRKAKLPGGAAGRRQMLPGAAWTLSSSLQAKQRFCNARSLT